MSGQGKRIDFELALVDPGAVFSTPEAVVACEELTMDERAEILCRWEYDARELEVSEEEGMADGEPSLLHRVARALAMLGYAVNRDRPPPTKQGGVGSMPYRKAPRPSDAS